MTLRKQQDMLISVMDAQDVLETVDVRKLWSLDPLQKYKRTKYQLLLQKDG